MPKTVVRCDDLHKAYGDQVLFDGASVEIRDDHRLAVIGRNGAGKSTFCRMILGQEQADAGRLWLHDDLRVSYLEQTDPFREGETVLAYLERATGREEWRCAEVGGKFLLGHELMDRPALGLSGGYQTRVRLCAMLLREPNFLILDEPTNYLDLRTLLLLENFLTSWKGAFLVVSHDREFLRRTCTGTLCVERGHLELHEGPVDDYLAFRAEQRDMAERRNANLSSKAKQLEDFVARNRARASTATQAQSKLKQLEKLNAEQIQIDGNERSVTMTIPAVETRPGAALRSKNLRIGYPDRIVADGIDLEVERGAKVAVLGDNGQGKSTLLRTLAASLPVLAGDIKWGYGIRIGHYAQHVYQAIPSDATVRSWLESCAAKAPGYTTSQQVQNLAGAFLFSGDAIDKRVSVLSGGERARLCLAGLLLGKFDVLLLDEPTNHLDVETAEALASALKAHNGTVIFVSHDRSFVSMVASDIVEVSDGRVTRYGDGYEHYCWRLTQEAREATGAAPTKTAEKKPPTVRVDKGTSTARNRLKQVEKELAKATTERDAWMAKLAVDPGGHAAEAGRRLPQLDADITRLEEEWLALSEQTGAGT
jgi:ATP-binding cassette, subfamily F, member 3